MTRSIAEPAPHPTAEEWRPAVEWPGYEVSSMGRVRNRHGRLLALLLTRDGYRRVSMHVDGKAKHAFVHRLVLFAWRGAPPSAGLVTRHLNGVRTDNRPENLTWGTAAENIHDRDTHGTTCRGERHYRAKLNGDAVTLIRQELRAGRRKSDLARRFNVSDVLIGLIARGRIWRHVA